MRLEGARHSPFSILHCDCTYRICSSSGSFCSLLHFDSTWVSAGGTQRVEATGYTSMCPAWDSSRNSRYHHSSHRTYYSIRTKRRPELGQWVVSRHHVERLEAPVIGISPPCNCSSLNKLCLVSTRILGDRRQQFAL